jgi:hypothetical protein
VLNEVTASVTNPLCRSELRTSCRCGENLDKAPIRMMAAASFVSAAIVGRLYSLKPLLCAYL